MTGKWAFQCAKNWHRPDPEFGVDLIPRNGKMYNGMVCSECACPYFELVGKISPILAPEGIVQGEGGH